MAVRILNGWSIMLIGDSVFARRLIFSIGNNLVIGMAATLSSTSRASTGSKPSFLLRSEVMMAVVHLTLPFTENFSLLVAVPVPMVTLPPGCTLNWVATPVSVIV